MNINDKDITFLFQGNVSEYTKIAINNCKNIFPNSCIILSTWNGCNIDGIKCNKIILNDDPGSFTCNNGLKYGLIYTNINRQLLSTKSGLQHIDTKYAMKLRSDLIIRSKNIIRYFNIFINRESEYSIFKNRILVNALTSKLYSDIDNNYPTPFHVSDWFFFGLYDDIKLFFDGIELIDDEKEYSNYTLKFPNKSPCKHLSFRYAPEQYICYSFFSKYYNINFSDWSDFSQNNILLSEKILMNNFVFLDYIQHKISTPKYRNFINKNNGYRYTYPGYIGFKKFMESYTRELNKKEKLILYIYLLRKNIKFFYTFLTRSHSNER